MTGCKILEKAAVQARAGGEGQKKDGTGREQKNVGALGS